MIVTPFPRLVLPIPSSPSLPEANVASTKLSYSPIVPTARSMFAKSLDALL